MELLKESEEECPRVSANFKRPPATPREIHMYVARQVAPPPPVQGSGIRGLRV